MRRPRVRFGVLLRARAVEIVTTVALRVAPRWTVRVFGLIEARRRQSALRLVDRLVRSGDVVVDIGAHRGVFTDRFARRVGPAGRVYAFEPNPDTWPVLRRVTSGNAAVSLYPVGLSDEPATATLYRPRREGRRVDAMGSVTVPRPGTEDSYDSVSVRLERLDTVLGSVQSPIALIKIDVEGHEMAVLKGGETLLLRWRPTILAEIEQRHQQTDMTETFRYLDKLGYRGWFLGPTGLRPLGEFDVARHQTGHLHRHSPTERPASGYVSDFVFLSATRPHGRTAG